MTTFLICLSIYIAIGGVTVWNFHQYMDCEVWWGWLVVVLVWPVFLWKVARS